MTPLHAVLLESVRSSVLPPGAAAGTIRFHVVGDDEDLVVTLAHARCTVDAVAASAPSSPPADLLVYASADEVSALLAGSQAPLRVSGERALLLALAQVVTPPKSSLATRLGAR